MRIALGSDHRGFGVKARLVDLLTKDGHEVKDFGVASDVSAAEMEPLVKLLAETPRERLLEEVAGRIKGGVTYQQLLAAVFLAGVRDVQPRPVGFKFHAVLVINSAHLAAQAARDNDRWLPLFWALDQYKSSQAANVKEGNWHLPPVEESKVPPSHKARAAFIDAMEAWDPAAADAAIAGYSRSG